MAAPTPTELSQAKREVLYEALREGMSIQGAAMLAGTSRATLYRMWQRDDEFRVLCGEHIASFERVLVNAATKAIADAKSPTGPLDALARRFPQQWSTRPEMRRDVGAMVDGEDEQAAQPTDEILRQAVSLLLAERMEKRADPSGDDR